MKEEHKAPEEHHHVHHEIHSESKPSKNKAWATVAIILGILVVLSVFTHGFTDLFKSSSTLSKEEASEKVLLFVNKELLQGQETEILNLLANYSKTLTLLEQYDKELAAKEEIIILTKTDLVDEKTLKKAQKELAVFKSRLFSLSIYDTDALKDFSDALVKLLRKKEQ